MKQWSYLLTLVVCSGSGIAAALAPDDSSPLKNRRQVLTRWMQGGTATALVAAVPHWPAWAVADQPDSMDVDEYLRTGRYGMPMGLSGQSGKSRPETGVILREGTEVARDARTGSVAAEILLRKPQASSQDLMPVLVSYESPWPLATGAVFDVECRDIATGESVFVAVTGPLKGQSLNNLSDDYIVQQLMQPTGRFSLYGQPTDIKVKQSAIVTGANQQSSYKQLDLSFATLSQATQTELPRRARVRVAVPTGADQAVLLVASAAANKWKSSTEAAAAAVMDSFVAIPAPATTLKVRGKARS